MSKTIIVYIEKAPKGIETLRLNCHDSCGACSTLRSRTMDALPAVYLWLKKKLPRNILETLLDLEQNYDATVFVCRPLRSLTSAKNSPRTLPPKHKNVVNVSEKSLRKSRVREKREYVRFDQDKRNTRMD
jgi:hypothetical protein